MSLEPTILGKLKERPYSGGHLIEILQADGQGVLGEQALIVYGALANLRAQGEIEVLAEGPGERLYSATGVRAVVPVHPGFPPSFSLGGPELAQIEKEVWRITRGLPPHYFEELRRAVVADADRRVFHGEKLPGAAMRAVAALGPATGTRSYLRRAERGGPVPLRIAAPPRLRWLVVPLVIVALLVVTRWFVIGVYSLPDDSASMAPTLMPGHEGGDDLVLVNLLAGLFGEPQRGEVWVFRYRDRRFVKRVVGRPGDEVGIVRGNLLLNGAVWLKERDVLDGIKIPLFDRSGFRETPSGLRPEAAFNANSFRNPDGNLNPSEGLCREVVVSARVRVTDVGGSVTFQLDNGWGGQEHVIVVGRTGLAAVSGQTVAMGPPLVIEPGESREIWFTNADGVFRIEIDGEEVVRVELKDGDKHARLTVLPEGAEIESLLLARDLHYTSARGGERVKLGPDEYFVLGDNSANSNDSRGLGAIRKERFVGRVFGVGWPPGRIRRVR